MFRILGGLLRNSHSRAQELFVNTILGLNVQGLWVLVSGTCSFIIVIVFEFECSFYLTCLLYDLSTDPSIHCQSTAVKISEKPFSINISCLSDMRPEEGQLSFGCLADVGCLATHGVDNLTWRAVGCGRPLLHLYSKTCRMHYILFEVTCVSFLSNPSNEILFAPFFVFHKSS